MNKKQDLRTLSENNKEILKTLSLNDYVNLIADEELNIRKMINNAYVLGYLRGMKKTSKKN